MTGSERKALRSASLPAGLPAAATSSTPAFGRIDRALADLVGGWDGGATLWELACARLARVAHEFAEEPMRFKSYPAGMLHRLQVACEDALQTVEVAVELQEALDEELPSEERALQLVDLLFARARRLADERAGLELPAG